MMVIPSIIPILIAIFCTKSAAVSLTRPPSIEKQPGFEILFQVSRSSNEADKPFTLDCEASGNPEPKFRWIKNGLPFDYAAYDTRINQLPKQGTLNFTKPDTGDEGLYQCFAENDHGTAVSNVVFLRKSEYSFDEEKPEEKNVVEGQPLTLECNPPTGYPKPVIFWIIISSSGPLKTLDSSRLTVDPEGRLHFSNVTTEDKVHDGMYACAVASPFGTEYKIGKRINFTVESSESGQTRHAPVKQYVSPPNIQVLRGHKLELNCIYGGTPLPDISWQKRGGIIEGSRYTYINFGKTLQINRVDFEDEGTYECTASNGVGTEESNTMDVRVESAPYWKIHPNSTNIDDGENVSFECFAEGVPEPELRWFMNGEPLENSPPNSRRKLDGNVLTIEKLVKGDTAVYQCNASNTHGYAFKDFYVNVLALKPTFIEKPSPVIKAPVNSTATLKCRFFGAPKPEIKWERNGIELKSDRFYVSADGDLRISNISNNDEGRYKCIGSNKFGNDSASVELEVEYYGTDNGVTNLSVVATESTGHLAKADWLIGTLCVIALVIILAILVCMVKRNRVGKYFVHEKEAALGIDPDEAGFDEYKKPLDPRNTGHAGSKSSLTSSLKHGDGNDADSMTDYGEDDSSKFGEDGSFIGEYGKKKNSTPQPPTFV